jgi:O-antigen/teichoic acid export membrane protein
MAVGTENESAVARRSSALLISVAVMGVGGIAFNAMAARLVSAEELGIQASLFFWMTLINQLTSMGLPVAVARLPRYAHTPSERPLLLWAFLYTSATSVVGAALFFLVAGHRLRPQVHDALGVWGGVTAFVVIAGIVTGFSLALLVEIRLMALGLGRWVTIRSVVINVARCGLLAVPALRREPMMLLVLNAGINAVSGVVGAVVIALWSRRESDAPMLPPPVELRPEFRFATVNWVGTIALLAAQFGFPVVADITPAQNAAFYLAWQIMAVVFVIPVTIGHVVVVEASRRTGHDSAVPFRKGLMLSVGLTGAAAAASFVLASPMTRWLFGDKYHTTATVLPLVLTAAVPWCVTSMYLARARADGNSVATITIASIYGVIVLGTAMVFTHNEPIRSATSWLVANSLAAVAVVGAFSFLRARTPRPAPVHSASL